METFIFRRVSQTGKIQFPAITVIIDEQARSQKTKQMAEFTATRYSSDNRESSRGHRAKLINDKAVR